MNNNLPDNLKPLQPFLQRSQELRQADPVVSYFCLYHAAKQAIQQGGNEEYLAGLLDHLETTKGELEGNPNMLDDAKAWSYCYHFALRVFAKADTQERAGRADKATARNFIISSQFLQILGSLGGYQGTDEEQKGVQEKIKYARWKASEILKGIREQTEVVASWPSPPSPPPINEERPEFIPVPAAQLPHREEEEEEDEDEEEELAVDPKAAKDAQKFARWAISALEYDDVGTAVENLQKSLDLLMPFLQ